VKDNQALLSIIWGIAILVGLVALFRRWKASIRLQGMREVVDYVARAGSYHYEREGEDLPEKVVKALDYLKYASSQKSPADRARLYAVGAGTLADAMGEAAAARGAQTAQFWMRPSDGEVRIDMPMESWIAIRYMADAGFQHKMPNYRHIMPSHFRSKEDAEKAEAALEKLEFAVRHSERDPEYSDSLSRNMLIWNQWPDEQKV
jgi:hypothetical protein